MRFLDVVRMLKAGFTAEEIRQMDRDDNPQETNPQNPQENPQAEPEPEQEQEPAAAAPDPIQELKDLFQGLKESNDNLAKVIQASNVQNASFGSNSIDDINKKAEDALKSLIRPDFEKEVK